MTIKISDRLRGDVVGKTETTHEISCKTTKLLMDECAHERQ